MAKVQFGLSNLHLFKLTETTDSQTGEVTSSYGSPFNFPGAVELTLSVESDEPDPFYADDSVYYQPAAMSKGYSGTLTVARLPENIRTAFLNFVKDQDDAIIEVNATERKYFGMTFENQTDEQPIKKVFYKCSFGLPEVSAATLEDQKTPATEAIPITVVPTAEKFTYTDGAGNEVTTSVVSGMADSSSDATVYANWHNAPHMPNFDVES